jgi:hypothetical protein
MSKKYIPDSKLEWYLLNALPEEEQTEIAALEQTDDELRGRIEALRASDAEILAEELPPRIAEKLRLRRYSMARGTARRSPKLAGAQRRWPLSIFIGVALMLILPLIMIVGPELIGIIEDGGAQEVNEAIIDTVEIDGAYEKGETEDTTQANIADSLK